MVPSEVSIKVGNLLNYTEAAKMLGCSRWNLYKTYILKGRIHPVSIGRNRFVLREDIEKLRAERARKYGGRDR